MRYEIYIIFISLFFIGCSDHKNTPDQLAFGKYYLDVNSPEDTLLFQKNRPKGIRREWNYMIWIVQEDSIFQEDSHGLLSCLGKDKCSYSIKYDTLQIKYMAKSGSDCKTIEGEQELYYKILESNRNEIRLALIPAITKHQKRLIRSDIQLR